MNKETMNENNKLDQVFNDLTANFVKILNDALEKERSQTEYWRRKAYILANKNGLCYQHETRESESNFNNLGKSFDYYISHGVDCSECNYKEIAGEKKIKGLHSEAINTVMEGVKKAQEKQAEQMKRPAQESERNEDLISVTFGEFAKSELKRVECVECKKWQDINWTEYDPARNKYTCKGCVAYLEQEQIKQKERQTAEAINKMEDKNSKE